MSSSLIHPGDREGQNYKVRVHIINIINAKPEYNLQMLTMFSTENSLDNEVLEVIIFELFFCKKIPLSRRVEYVMDGSMDQSVSQSVSD